MQLWRTRKNARAHIRARTPDTHARMYPQDAWQESGYHAAVIGIALWPLPRHGSASHLRTDTHALKADLLCVCKRASERAADLPFVASFQHHDGDRAFRERRYYQLRTRGGKSELKHSFATLWRHAARRDPDSVASKYDKIFCVSFALKK